MLPATALIEVELTQLLQSSGQTNDKQATIQQKVTVPLPGKSRQSVFGKPGFIVFTPPPELYGSPTPSSSTTITTATLSESPIEQQQQQHVVPFVPHLSGSQAHPLLTRLQELISKQAGADHLETPDDWQAQVTEHPYRKSRNIPIDELIVSLLTAFENRPGKTLLRKRTV